MSHNCKKGFWGIVNEKEKEFQKNYSSTDLLQMGDNGGYSVKNVTLKPTFVTSERKCSKK